MNRKASKRRRDYSVVDAARRRRRAYSNPAVPSPMSTMEAGSGTAGVPLPAEVPPPLVLPPDVEPPDVGGDGGGVQNHELFFFASAFDVRANARIMAIINVRVPGTFIELSPNEVTNDLAPTTEVGKTARLRLAQPFCIQPLVSAFREILKRSRITWQSEGSSYGRSTSVAKRQHRGWQRRKQVGESRCQASGGKGITNSQSCGQTTICHSIMLKNADLGQICLRCSPTCPKSDSFGMATSFW